VSTPTPNTFNSSGAAALTIGASWSSIVASSASRAWTRRARIDAVVFVARITMSPLACGRSLAASLTSCVALSEPRRARSSSGAVNIRWRS
jgi:hypothetical protein